jgi:signal transduction histidine kinase
VLQVLALVQRHGSELGGRGAELAQLASAQEIALRTLITGDGPPDSGAASTDLRTLLAGLASPMVQFATPADPVVLPTHAAREVHAAVAAALDNVHRHAGPAAQAWVLVEDEADGVRVTVRDNGSGMPEGRLEEAATAGRLGVAQSMRGRIADLDGSTAITSRPGEGTEVEFRIPRSVTVPTEPRT